MIVKDRRGSQPQLRLSLVACVHVSRVRACEPAMKVHTRTRTRTHAHARLQHQTCPPTGKGCLSPPPTKSQQQRVRRPLRFLPQRPHPHRARTGNPSQDAEGDLEKRGYSACVDYPRIPGHTYVYCLLQHHRRALPTSQRRRLCPLAHSLTHTHTQPL